MMIDEKKKIKIEKAVKKSSHDDGIVSGRPRLLDHNTSMALPP